MNFDNVRFSHYKFSKEEIKNLYCEDKETSFPLYGLERYIVFCDYISSKESDEIITKLYKVLKFIKSNPNFSFLEFNLIYSKSEYDMSAMILVSQDTWYFIKGLLINIDEFINEI